VVVVHVYNPSFVGGIGRLESKASLEKSTRSYLKNN
jgi:hypothetical protein